MNIYEKEAVLQRIITETNGIVIGFSGGVDSSYLIYTASKILGERAVAVTARSSTYTKEEFDHAAEFVKKHNIRQVVIESEELDIEGFSANPPDRCYFCKRELFTKILNIAKGLGIEYVADGANMDDVNDYRPGMKAAAELNVISPLKQAGLSKSEIRQLSKEAGLDTWDKPAAACLASRFPYGNTISREKLEMVEKAERYIRDMGFREFRVRHHEEIARIEISPSEMGKVFDVELMKNIYDAFKKIGFSYTALDLAGYRTGSMNEILPGEKVKK